MAKYLDNTGLSYLWGKIKSLFVPQTRTVNGKALSSNITLTAEDVGAPIELIENNDSTNKKPLRSIDSGTYVLSGYFTSYEGGTESFTFNSGMVVAILKESSKSYIQVFYPKSNVIQYLEITDSAVTRKDAKLVNMESVANRVSAITSSSDTSHYPSAKAVYDAIQASGVPQTGSTAPETTTKGVVGQPYFVIVDNSVTEMYVCTSALIGSYTWDKLDVDATLTKPGEAADAKAVGDALKTKIGLNDLPKYDGAVEIVPDVDNAQVLKTAQKYMESDVKISKIPYKESQNSAGGITVTIG